MTLIDDDQRVFIPELIQIRRYRLHTGKCHLMVAFLALQPGGEDAAGQPITLVFGVILLYKFFDVGQHQNFTLG